MNNVLNQNWEMLEETLTAFNSAAVKTTLQGLRNFKITHPLLQVFEKPLSISFLLCHMRRQYYQWLSRLRRHIQ